MINKQNNEHVPNVTCTIKCETEPKSLLNGECLFFFFYFRNTSYCVLNCYFDSFFFIQVYTYNCSFARVLWATGNCGLWNAYIVYAKKWSSDWLSDVILVCFYEVATICLSPLEGLHKINGKLSFRRDLLNFLANILTIFFMMPLKNDII